MIGWLRKNRNGKKPKADEPEIPKQEEEAMQPEVVSEDEAEKYERGEFLVTDKERADQLRQHDSEARQVYSGIETQIERLKRLTTQLKHKKLKCVESEGGHGRD